MSSLKNTNPKDAAATTRLPLHLVPPSVRILAAMSFAEGAEKYGAYNWRVAGVRMSVYVAAIGRHLEKLWHGQWEDPKTKVPHLASIIAGCGIIEDARVAGKLTDDRPPEIDVDGQIAEAEAVIAHLAELFADYQPTQWTRAEVENQKPMVFAAEPLPQDASGRYPDGLILNPEPKYLDCGWVEHRPGDPQPVLNGTKVELLLRNGDQLDSTYSRAGDWDWSSRPSEPTQIVAYRLAEEGPKKLDCGWIDRRPGDPQPVADDTKVEVLLRNGEQFKGLAECWVWTEELPEYAQIVAYRPV